MRRVNTLWMLGWMAMAAAGCTKRNPEVCCETEAECKTVGFSTPSPCDDGVCVNYSCAATGCDGDEDCRDPLHPTCVEGQCYGAIDACRAGGGGRFLFVSTRDSKFGLYSMYKDGSAQKLLTENIYRNNDIDIRYFDAEVNMSPSPDGMSIAFVGASGPTLVQTIFTIKSDGQALSQITDGVEPDDHVEWSPDGAKLVVSTDFDGVRGMASVMRVDGSHIIALRRSVTDASYDPSWSHDSTRIVFISRSFALDNENSDVVSVRDDGAMPVIVDELMGAGQPGSAFKADLFKPRWSPDGSVIAYLSN